MIKERLRWPENRDDTLWGVAAERAYEERQEIMQRTKTELDALRDAGKLVGRAPFGFTIAGERYDRKLVPTEIGRKYIPQIYQKCIDGWSMAQIAAWLNAEGVKPQSGKWWPRSIGLIIKSPTYLGFRCQQDPKTGEFGKILHRCEALVDAGTWKAANEAFTGRPKRGYFDAENRAMLAGGLVCARCDSPMYAMTAGRDKRNKPYRYYRCHGTGALRKGCGNLVRVDVADSAVSRIIAEDFNTPVMEYRIIRGNEAEIETELEKIRFEICQLGSLGLSDEEEDSRCAELRARRDEVQGIMLIEDTVKLVKTGELYAALWARLSIPERGPWLTKHGFRVYASKAEVTVAQGETSATVSL